MTTREEVLGEVVRVLWLETWRTIGICHWYQQGMGAPLEALARLVDAGWRTGYYEATLRDMRRFVGR
jgi:hypothetical protein